MRQDLRQAVRLIQRRPGVSALVVATLAIGIAATTIVFSLADAILWHPLPFPDAGRLVRIHASISSGSIVGPALEGWGAKDQIVDGVYPFGMEAAIVSVGDEPQAVTISELSPGLLDTLGVTPAQGRAFTAEEFRRDSGVVLVSAQLWQRVQAVGGVTERRTLLVEGVPQTIVGVIPEGFDFPVGRVALWRPYVASATTTRISALGKLKPGVTIDAARAVARAVGSGRPDSLVSDVTVTPFIRVDPATSAALRVLLGAVAMLLLVAVANAANVQLAEAVRRDVELAVRASLGASWPRLARQIVTETLLVSAIAAAVALLMSAWVLGTLVKAVPYLLTFQVLRPIALDWRALSFAAAVATVAGLGASWLSVARARRIAAAIALRGQASGLPGHARARGVLTVAQIAVTLAVLASAGLLGNNFLQLSRLDPGFQPDHLVQLVFEIPTWRFQGEPQTRTAVEQLRADALRLPDVVGATVTHAIPPSLGSRPLADLEVADSVALSSAGPVWSGQVDETFFSTLGIPVLAGRPFDTGDRVNSEPVAVISRSLAARWSSTSDVLGRRFREAKTEPWRTVVGVVGDVTNRGVDQELGQLAYYIPRAQTTTWWYEGLIVRARPSPEQVVPELRALIRRTLPDAPITEVATAYDTIASSNGRVRFATILMATFAGVALLLALVGVYGAFWYAVRQRTREIGVRLALGAAPADVLRMILFTSARLTLIGLALGLPLAVGAARALRSLLVGVSPADPATFAVVTIFLAVAAIAATYLPARRASRVEPVSALRQV